MKIIAVPSTLGNSKEMCIIRIRDDTTTIHCANSVRNKKPAQLADYTDGKLNTAITNLRVQILDNFDQDTNIKVIHLSSMK